MKVLWFTNTASNCPGEKSSAGGGWISSLETAMRGRGDVELGVSFFGSGVSDSVHDGPVSYFPVLRDRRCGGFSNWQNKTNGTFRIACGLSTASNPI